MIGTGRGIAARHWATIAQWGKVYAPLREPPFPGRGTAFPTGETPFP
jgi:hypothetical protein